jgi:uncharacterized protein YegL
MLFQTLLEMSGFQITNIDNSEVLIHTNKETLPLTNIGEDEYFGILKIKVAKTKLVKTPTFLLFTIDKTGSMNDKQTGITTKMDYVVQTFISMMNYLSTLETDMYIQVNTFNTDVDVLVQCVKITVDNVEEINSKIKSLVPDGSTNIGKALTVANENISEYMEKNTTHQIAHIFMTDGDPTIGELSETILSNKVNEKYNNIIVGFGYNHNVSLLSKMAEKKNAEYQFVDNMENTTLVYGEAIHKFIYPALRSVEIHIENGTLYDWQTNQWTQCLYEDIIIGEIEKIYHIKTTHPINVDVNIYGAIASIPVTIDSGEITNEFKLLDTAMSMPDLIDIESDEIQTSDLTKYAFRQKVQELLYEAKQYERNANQVKNDLCDAFKFIRKYMRTNNLKEDGLLKMLCDDLSITYRSMFHNRGRALLLARHTSQGKQRTYNAGSTHASDDIENILFQRNQFDNIPSIPMTPRKLQRLPTIQRQHTRNISFPDLDVTPKKINLSLQIPSDDEINDDPFTKYEESGFFVPPRNVVFKNIFDDDEYSSEDEVESYLPEQNNTTCFATPGVLDTMRTMSSK